MNNLVQLTRETDVAVITIDNPPVNALSPGVPEGIIDAVNEAVADEAIRAIVMIAAGQTFIAGADIREFGKIKDIEKLMLGLLPFIAVIEDSPKPIVMAIHGAAFGGGLETAMAGHYRVIAPTAQVGQPEVKLGLIPGMGGTQRLPRLVGVPKAVEMCAFGESLKAGEALQLGLVDRVIEGNLLEGAVAFAREHAGKPTPKTRLRDEKLADVDPVVFSQAHEQANKMKRLQRAPHAAIEAVEAATRLPFEEASRRERELFIECLASTESKALIHVFFGERTVGKIPGLSKDTQPYNIKRAAVIGAGTMGGGIAMTYANAGIPVILKEVAQEALDRGIATIRNNYANTVRKRKLAQEALEQRLSLIQPQLTYDGFEQADIIVEAVFESMAVKKTVFSEIARVASSDCILATNTSTLDVDEIASVTGRPEMVIGTHFFSPANVMRLLEVVRGASTSDRVIATAMGLGKKLGKVAVLARNGFGFIGNRMVVPYIREAQFLVEEGASVEQVNDALYDFGMPMGPLAMDDLAGLDVTHHIRREAKHLEKEGVRRPLLPDLLYQMGRYGQKTGKGWSRYDEQRRPQADPEVSALIEATARTAGIKRREISNAEIVERCVYALINEGAKVLEEGIALRAVDIDIVYIFGYGFPAWRGGPMFYANTIGLKSILSRIAQFKSEHGNELWEPAPLLKSLAESGGTFA
ncbi:MAG: 3-hydroxyacyl-CoA dehydrogenase NAD-binding domain-containing protein [Acidobacteriota bacterium]|nr:3-hydroxyacyl-CoA dehydrogenase NAD-binding domain-containing protein [Acidobacteriota bacterium]